MSSQALTDIGEIKTFFTGDVSSLEKASQQAPQIVARATQSINQVLAQPAAGFSHLATSATQSSTAVTAQMNSMSNSVGSFSSSALASMSQAAQGINTSFSTVGTGVQSSLSTASTATQQASASMQTSLAQVSTAAASVPPSLSNIAASAQTAGQSIGAGMSAAVGPIAAIGTTATQAGTQAAAGLNSIASAAQTPAQALQQLEGAFKSNQSAIVGLSGNIAENRSRMADLSSQMTALTLSGQKYTEVTNEQGKTSRVLSETFTGLRNEYMQLGSQTRVLSAEQGTYRAANQAVAQSIEQTAEKTSFLTKLFGTKTNMVATAGTAFVGYDRILQTALASMGGVTLGMSLLITVAGLLIPKIGGLTGEKEKQIKADKELAVANALLAQSMQGQLSLGPPIADFTQAQTIANTDLSVAIITVADAQMRMSQNVKDLEKAQRALEVATTADEAVIRQHGQTTESWARITRGAREAIADSSAALQEQRAEIEPSVEALQALQAVYGLSTDRVIELAKQMGYGEQVLQGLRSTIDSNAAAMSRLAGSLEGMSGRMLDATVVATNLRLALQQIKAPSFDVAGTEQGIANLAKTAQAGLEAARSGFASAGQAVAQTSGAVNTANSAFRGFNSTAQQTAPLLKSSAEQFEANKKNIKPLEEGLKRFAASQAAAAGEAGNAAAVQRRYREEIAKLPADLKRNIDHLDQTDKAAKALADSTKKAGGGAAAARPMLNEFAAGVLGIDKAIQVVLSRMGDAGLFDAVNKKNRASLAEFKAASKELADAAEEMFRSMGVKVKVSAEQIATLGKTLAKPFLESVLAFQKLQSAVDDLNFKRAAGQLALLDNEFKIQGKTIELSITTYNALSNTVKTELTKIGFTFKTVFPAAKEQILDFNEGLKAAEIGTRDFADKTATYIKDWSKKTDKELESVQERFKQFGTDAPSWSGGIVEACTRVKKAIEESIPVAITKAKLEVQQSINSMIGNLEQLATELNLSGDAWERYVEDGIRQTLETANLKLKEHERLSAQTIDAIVEKWKKGLVKLPGIWDQVFKDASASTRKNVDDILTIIDLIPGGVGDALRKAESEFQRWVKIIDSVIRILERSIGNENQTEGLMGAIGSLGKALGGIFNKAAPQTKASAEVWADQVGAVLGSMEGEAGESGKASGDAFQGEFMKKVQAIATGLSIFFGTRGQGKAVGVLGGAAAGATIGAAFGGIIGAGIGAGVGAIVGLFGTGGPSEEEKRRAEEARKNEIEQIRQSLAKSNEEIKQMMIQTARDFLKFIDELAASSQIPKDVLNKFINNMVRTLLKLAEAMKAIAPKVSAETQRASEQLAPAVTLMANMPLAFKAINEHFGVADSQIDLYFSDLDKIAEHIGASADKTPGKLEKNIKKYSERLLPSIDLMKGVGELIKMMFDTKDAPDEKQFGLWEKVIDMIVQSVIRLADKTDKWLVKTMAAYASKAKEALSFWKDGTDAIRATKDVPALTQTDVDNTVGSLELFLTALVARLSSLQADELNKLAAMGASISSVASALKNWAETSEVIRGYTAISADVWELIPVDFRRGLDLLHLMLADALVFEKEAIDFEKIVLSGASHLDNGIRAYTQSLTDTFSHLNGVMNNIGGGIAAGSVFGDGLNLSVSHALAGGESSAFIPQTAPLTTSLSAPARGGDTYIIHVHGSILTERELNERIDVGVEQNRRRRG